jgi:DNA segregation ATPase FtsK/SpoIIIE, S-DNA-T family
VNTSGSSGQGSDRLVPLPKRAPGEDELVQAIAASPADTVADLLERTDHLLAQLQTDIAGLRADQAKEQSRIERERHQRQTAARAAIEQLKALAVEARAIAEHKARTDVLDAALARPAALDPGVTFPTLVRRIEEELRLARGITGAIRLGPIGQLLVQAAAHVDHLTRETEMTRHGLLRETEHELRSEGKEARASYEIGMSVVRRDLRALDLALPPSGLPWDDPRWARWDGWDPMPGGSRWIRYGSFYRPELERFRFPALLALPGERGLALDVATGDRDTAVAAARSLLLRLLAAVPAGDMRFTIADPVGLGDSIGSLRSLTDWSPELLDGGVATGEVDIEQRLAGLVEHVQTVVQQHLRGEHETLDQHHRALGEVVEPYRVVVVFDYPTKLSTRARQLLRELIDHGPRAGIHTLVVTAPGAARANGAKWRGMLAGLDIVRGDPDGYWYESPVAGRWRVDLDPAPEAGGEGGEPSLSARLITTAGEHARQGRRTDVTAGRLYERLGALAGAPSGEEGPDLAGAVDLADPETWWRASAARRLAAPLGRAGARGVALLSLDGGARGGALVGGERRSGVSTLLHTAITGWSLLYGPDEVELHLVDLSPEGSAGFDVYAHEALPHARAVATAAGRELAVSVLDELHRELNGRSLLFAPHGGERCGVDGYRAATGEHLPRVVAVIDGADRLVASDDRLAERAAQLLDVLVRQGPAHGIHLVLATHQAAPLVRQGRRLTDHLRVRVALACGEEESRVLLGGDNGEAALCASAGEGVLATIGGAVAAEASQGGPNPTRFRTSAFEPHELGLILRDLRRRADTEGHAHRRPQVHEGGAPARLEDSAIRRLVAGGENRPARLRPRLWLGEPAALGSAVEVTLRREPGANLLVVGREERFGSGLLAAALASAALVHGQGLDARVLDLMPLESGFGEAAAALGRSVPVTLARRRNLDGAYRAVLAEIDDRVARQDFTAPPVLVVVNGLGAGPVAALEAGRLHGAAATATPDDVTHPGLDPVAALERIVREGPEVGVHALVWTDRLSSLGMHVSRATMREFALRVVMQMPAEDSALLIDSAQAAALGPNEALLYDEDAGRLTTVRPYQLPPVELMAELGAMAATTGTHDLIGRRPSEQSVSV